uniref:Crotasin-like_protein n=1 Tax=Ovophis okinavensis TaxID=8769 RepID=U3TBL2_OVOOK|nr:crotasin-like_protein [Ovophis okinavensis]
MKILYLLFAFLFLAFLSEPGNAQGQCYRPGGLCLSDPCPSGHLDLGQVDCQPGQKCCRRGSGK